MRYLRQNTAVHVTVGPFFDKTDGVTPEIALTVTGCHITLMVDDDDNSACNLVIDADATASDGDNDMVHVTNDNAGFYDLELTAAQTNYTGRAMLAITDAATHCPVFHEFQILAANVYDSLFVGAGVTADKLQVDAVEVSSDSAAADTLELFAEALDQASGQLDAGTLHDDTITAASINTGAFTADAFASDAIAAAAVKADAVTKIQTGLATPTNITAASGVTLAATTGLGNQTANITGNLSGSVGSVTGAVGSVTGAVGSVTGAVGSVTGNVGGNVTGSVGSVVGAVGSVTGAVGSVTTKTGYELTAAYDSAKTAAQAGDGMDLVDAPNATAIAAIKTAVEAITGDTGITLAKALEMLAAFVAGKVSASSSGGVTTYTYKKRDGSATSFTSACSETDGTRATTGSLT